MEKIKIRERILEIRVNEAGFGNGCWEGRKGRVKKKREVMITEKPKALVMRIEENEARRAVFRTVLVLEKMFLTKEIREKIIKAR